MWLDDDFLRQGIDYVMNNYEQDTNDLTALVCEQLESVYDPEFPMIDIFTLGLIYSIIIDSDEEIVEIIMSYTTPACPEGERIQQMITNALHEALPSYTVDIQITFDPQWSMDLIKDQDLRRLFE